MHASAKPPLNRRADRVRQATTWWPAAFRLPIFYHIRCQLTVNQPWQTVNTNPFAAPRSADRQQRHHYVISVAEKARRLRDVGGLFRAPLLEMLENGMFVEVPRVTLYHGQRPCRANAEAEA